MTFLGKLQVLSNRRGQSLRTIALELGFDPSAPAQWKRRHARPRPELAKKLADYFAIPVDLLLDDSKDLPVEYPPIRPATEAVREDSPLLTPAGRISFEKKALQEFTEADIETLIRNYPEEARDLAASWQQIQEAAAVISAAKVQLKKELSRIFGDLPIKNKPP